jgi:exodeoxyribonuclease VII small subunit
MTKKQTLEKALEQLEKLVLELESGELQLEEALKKFETGVQLTQFCNHTLDESEKKITILMKDQNGDRVEQPFKPENQNSNE